MFGIKEKKKSKTIKNYAKEVNQNILNMITPSGVDFDRSHLNVSENIGTVLCISRYPAEAGFGWLTTVCNLESTQTKIEFRYTAPDRLSKQLNKRLSELKEAVELSKEESEKQSLNNAIENLKELVNRIVVKGEPVGYVNILLYITADNREELLEKLTTIKLMIRVISKKH